MVVLQLVTLSMHVPGGESVDPASCRGTKGPCDKRYPLRLLGE